MSNTFTGSTVTYNYDALGRITNRAIDGVAEQLTYDALGRVTGITNVLGSFTNTYLRATALLTTNFCPNGKTTVFSYLGVTNNQRLASIWNQNVNGSTLSKFDYAYDALGQITNWTQQTDNTATNVQVIQYDPVNQLLAVTVHGNTAAGAILQQYAYGYDASGNRTTEQIGNGNGGTTPVAMSQSSYNANNQLTSRAGGTGQMLFAGNTSKPATVTVAGNAATVNHQTTNFFGYTSVTNGTNVIPVTATDYSANSATNRYQIIVTNNGVAKTITFDLNGNQTAVVTATSTNTYQWDAANRLVSIIGPTNQSSFTYDGLGRRVQIIEMTNGMASNTNKYLWVGMHIFQQRNISATVTKRFFKQGEQVSGANYYFTKDHYGSIREMVDSIGIVQARYDYDPYGRKIKISGSLDADFGYAGYYNHATSGLYLTLFRVYDADFGRWLSRDPIFERGGLNLYGFVKNNPFNRKDMLGDCPLANPANAEAFAPGSTGSMPSDVTPAQALGFMVGAIAIEAIGTAALFVGGEALVGAWFDGVASATLGSSAEALSVLEASEASVAEATEALAEAQAEFNAEMYGTENYIEAAQELIESEQALAQAEAYAAEARAAYQAAAARAAAAAARTADYGYGSCGAWID